MSVSPVLNDQMRVNIGLERIWKKAVFGPVEVLILASAWKNQRMPWKKKTCHDKPALQPRFRPSTFEIQKLPLRQPPDVLYKQASGLSNVP
jgi:hypothetical protein